VRTQKLAAVAMTYGGSFAAAAAAKQIVQRHACDSCGGFGARCVDCLDRPPNVVESYIECPDRERPSYGGTLWTAESHLRISTEESRCSNRRS
jgi:hypothetical protein